MCRPDHRDHYLHPPRLAQFPGGEHAQFWWLFGVMVVTAVVMLAMFRSKRWI